MQQSVKHILEQNTKVPGQFINYHKSKVQFCEGVSKVVKKEIVDILDITPSNTIAIIYNAIILTKE